MCVTSTSVSRGIWDQGSLPLSYREAVKAAGGKGVGETSGGEEGEEKEERAVLPEGHGG